MTYAGSLFQKPNVTGNIGDWQGRHMQACIAPRGLERPLVRMIEQWLRYADSHEKRFESLIGDDYVLGEHWFDMGLALRGLLNGESDRLDCGTLDYVILTALKRAGFDTDSL